MRSGGAGLPGLDGGLRWRLRRWSRSTAGMTEVRRPRLSVAGGQIRKPSNVRPAIGAWTAGVRSSGRNSRKSAAYFKPPQVASQVHKASVWWFGALTLLAIKFHKSFCLPFSDHQWGSKQVQASHYVSQSAASKWGTGNTNISTAYVWRRKRQLQLFFKFYFIFYRGCQSVYKKTRLTTIKWCQFSIFFLLKKQGDIDCFSDSWKIGQGKNNLFVGKKNLFHFNWNIPEWSHA